MDKRKKNKKTLSGSAFLKNVHDTIKLYGMLEKDDSVIVGISGGPDSVCLLKTLIALKKKLGIEIIAANVDHCLRGKESSSESDFVTRLAADSGITCVHKKIDINLIKTKKISIEEKARNARYKFFFETADKLGVGVISTGHNLNDQAETVFMRMLQGSSAEGLTGIPPVRFENNIKIIRPLIRTSREEIMGFLNIINEDYVEDSSNFESKYVRNKIRNEIIPFLENYNPQIKRSLANLADSLREDLELIRSLSDNCSKTLPDSAIEIKYLVLQPVSLRKQIFKELFRKNGGNVKKLTYRHWMDFDLFLRTSVNNSKMDLPGSVKIIRKKNIICFEKL